jgi:parallel beta-helix repeat protein
MLFSFMRQLPKARPTQRKRTTLSLSIEPLEDRAVPANLSIVNLDNGGPITFNVLNLNNSGAGSLRQAILSANAHAGADIIDFDVAGTIRLTTSALPTITSMVNIDGATAPGFVGTPLIAVNYNHFGGLQFNAGAAGSTLRSLDLVNAAGNGVTLKGAGSMVIAGNFIGLGLDGVTVSRNSGNGLELDHSSGNTIGGVTAQDQNIISGNGSNGIDLNGSSNNQILGNSIGTDVTGTLDRGNAGNGILVTAGSTGNLIGGDATGGNDPTNGVFVRPPQGNLISGNNANGVLINGNATQNTLSGNFIGTAASGDSALGNRRDGVAIVNANGNSLLGCTLTTDPFVFYNVISGNGANGLQVTNSNNTTIQANFFGLGANNLTAVGNALNGVVVEGSSRNTTMGGPIPLGNVDSANGENGILVQGTASFFVSYNTFCGLAAFETYPNLGNGWDGIKITSTGGNILIRTCVITENGNDGIEISGAATGVRVAGNIVGMDTNGEVPMGNKNNGVEVDGAAHNIIVGGPQPTFNIIAHNVISANGGNGVAVNGNAHNVQISFSDIGTNLLGLAAFGNAKAGVFLGAGTYSATIGSMDPSLPTVISGNLGDGVEMRGTHGNTLVGTLIGADVTGLLPLPNGGDGVFLSNSFNNLIGGASASANGTAGGSANLIAFNDADGVYVASGSGNAIRGNSIFGNALLGIDLGASANMSQAAPVRTSVLAMPLGMQVSGTLTTTPNATFTIEFFANNADESSGHYFLGSMKVKSNATGVATFTFFGSLPPNGANFVTATVTDLKNNTSEFSAAKM